MRNYGPSANFVFIVAICFLLTCCHVATCDFHPHLGLKVKTVFTL